MVYNPNFQWKLKAVTITANTALPAGYQVKLTIPKEAEMQSDFRDLRFETTDGYGLSHWLETIVSTTATVWVKLKAIVSTSGTVVINMYYGNPYVASASNGINTFDIFDDFDKDLSQWTQTGTAHTVSGGVLQQRLTAKAAGQEVITKPSSLTTGIWEYRLKKNAGGNMFIGAFLFGSSYNNAYLYIQYMNSGESYISKVVNGSHTALITVNSISDIGTFHIIKTTRDSTGIFKIYLDNALLGTSPADTTFTSSTITGIGDPFGGDGSTTDWDYVRARKYVATEPSTPTISSTATTVNWNPQRKPITINNTSGGVLTDYQVKLTIPFAQEMNNDFSDLRFVSSSNAPLSYWLESSTPGQTADIWIKTSLITGANTIYMHYGNPNLTSASDGVATFDFFDDFLGTTIDTSKWTGTTGSASISNSIMSYSSTSGWQSIASISSFSSNIALRTKANVGQTHPQLGLSYDISGANKYSYLYATDFDTFDNGTYGRISYVGKINTDTWHIYDINYISGTSVELKTDNVSTQIRTPYPGGETRLIRVSDYSSAGVMQIDWLLIRKYMATEPTFSIGSSETMNTFSNRKTVTINNSSGGALTDYQIPITVTYAAVMQPDFDDIRFVDSSGNLLPYWIESQTPSTTANVWIKCNLPNYGASPTGDNIVYMYYGNANLTSASDGNNTFIAFDDFNNSSKTGWTENGGTWIESGGVISQTSTTAICQIYKTVPTGDYYVEADVRPDTFHTSSKDIGIILRTNGVAGGSNPTGHAFCIMTNDTTKVVGLDQFVAWGTPVSAGLTFTNGTWYSFKVLANLSGNTAYKGKAWLKGGSEPAWQIETTGTSRTEKTVGLHGGTNVNAVTTASWDNFRVRKYASPEPTVSIGTEETPAIIGATAMTITPSETPCRVGICTANISVTWTNTGGTGMFTPSIVVDSTTYLLTPESLGAGLSVEKIFTISGLTTGTHSICPNPN